MEVRIGVDGGDEDASLGWLYRWLLSDDELTGEADISLVAAEPVPGGQGAAFEVINAVVSDVLSLAGVIVAARTGARARGTGLRFEARGVTVIVDPDADLTPEEIVALLRGQEDSGDSGDGS
ncbi:effector-associated constant component EACC1 [Streptomyces naphthomycinicus]|uniref:effector-associated constant component EACC1 n=1 Tax=Streptomyces naphthomycinicus TaxID=2872625 RepID=UPI001CEDD14A|nr:hypothetical protein [Streptomyces sp. TML10]